MSRLNKNQDLLKHINNLESNLMMSQLKQILWWHPRAKSNFWLSKYVLCFKAIKMIRVTNKYTHRFISLNLKCRVTWFLMWMCWWTRISKSLFSSVNTHLIQHLALQLNRLWLKFQIKLSPSKNKMEATLMLKMQHYSWKVS